MQVLLSGNPEFSEETRKTRGGALENLFLFPPVCSFPPKRRTGLGRENTSWKPRVTLNWG